jgi:hypothetical protein
MRALQIVNSDRQHSLLQNDARDRAIKAQDDAQSSAMAGKAKKGADSSMPCPAGCLLSNGKPATHSESRCKKRKAQNDAQSSEMAGKAKKGASSLFCPAGCLMSNGKPAIHSESRCKKRKTQNIPPESESSGMRPYGCSNLATADAGSAQSAAVVQSSEPASGPPVEPEPGPEPPVEPEPEPEPPVEPEPAPFMDTQLLLHLDDEDTDREVSEGLEDDEGRESHPPSTNGVHTLRFLC